MEIVHVEPVENAGVLLLTGEELGDFRAVQAFLQIGVHIGAFVGNLLPYPALGGLDDHDDRHEDRDTGGHHQGQLHIHSEHEDGDDDQVEDLQHEVDDAVGEHIRYVVDVMDNTGQNFPVRAAVVEGKGQLLQMVEEVLAHIVDDALAHPGHDLGADGDQSHAQGDGQDQEDRQPNQLHVILAGDGNVCGVFEDQRVHLRSQGRNHAGRQGDDHQFRVFLGVDRSPFEMLYIKRRFQGLVHVVFVAGCHYSSPPIAS